MIIYNNGRNGDLNSGGSDGKSVMVVMMMGSWYLVLMVVVM